MKKIMFTVVGVATVMVMTGCATKGNGYRVSETTGVRLVGAGAAARPQMRKQMVVVKANPADDRSAALARALDTSVEADFVARGFEVGNGQDADTDVVLSVSLREQSRLDEWRIDEGTAEVRVIDRDAGSIIGVKSFTAVGQRSLDEAKSVASVGTALVGQVLPWLAKTLPNGEVPLPPPGLTVTQLTIRPEDSMAAAEEVLAVQRRFMEVVAARPGVRSCRLVQELSTDRSYVFSVEYEPQSFPDGFVNTIVLDNPRLDGFGLKIAR